MSSTLRKCVSFAPPPTARPPLLPVAQGYAADYLFHGNDRFISETGTRWIKLWARWDLIQPARPDRVPWERLGDPANPGFSYVESLDAQIAHARAQMPPVGVVLQPYAFPRWANGTGDVVAGQFSAEDFGFESAQRMSAEAVATGDLDAPRKPLYFGLPPFSQMGVDGWWGRWVRFLYERYMHHGCGFALDLVNEPNNQWWPQRGPDSAVRYCARMMQAAQRVAAEHGHPAPLGAPGLADIVGASGDLLTNYSDFVPALLDELDRIGFVADPQFIWTHHNYVDMEADPVYDTAGTPSRAADVRGLVAGRWSGWRGRDPDVPGIWLTEGGVRVSRLLERGRAIDVAEALALQAALIRRSWDRHETDVGPEGPGIEMLTNYQMYTDPGYDSGLREPLEPGDARPAFEAWRRLPSRA